MSTKTRNVIANILLGIMWGISYWGLMFAVAAIIYGRYIHSVIAIIAVVISILVANKAANYIIYGGSAKKSTKRL